MQEKTCALYTICKSSRRC